MNRILIVLASAVLVLLVMPEWACAQGWSYAGDPLQRGPGFYLAWPKLLGVALLFLLWVYTTDWVNYDTDELGDRIKMPGDIWNPIVAFTFPVITIVALIIPIFAVSMSLIALAWAVPLGVYTFQRNARVQKEEKVLTVDHISGWLKNFGRRKRAKKKAKMPYEEGPPIEFKGIAAPTSEENQANVIAARQSPGFVTLKQLVHDMIRKNAERCMLDYTQEAVGVRYEIDGIWHNLDPRERETYDVLLAVTKKLCNLNPDDRRSRQEGKVQFKIGKPKYFLDVTSQGTQTGERALLRVSTEKSTLDTLEKLGMRDKMRERLKELLASKGIVIVSAMPQGGLTSLMVGTLNATDRMLRDFISIQDKNDLLPYVENVDVHEYDGAAGETPDASIRKLALKQPDAFVVPNLPNAETVRLLCEQVNKEDRLVVGSVRHKEASEALMRVLLLKAPAGEFAKAVTGVLNERLVRRLCDNCKQGYEPPPQLLQRLGIPPGRVKTLYREWQPPPPDSEEAKKEQEPCQVCHGLGYRGRIGIFELLVVDDSVRQVLVNQPKLEVLRQVARKAGTRTLQEEGVLLVAQGVTSINELQRALKA